MSDYCKQDVKVTLTLIKRIAGKGLPEEAIELEHEVQRIIYRQEQYGFLFDKEKAERLYATLLKRQKELNGKLQEFFPPWYVGSAPSHPSGMIRARVCRRSGVHQGQVHRVQPCFQSPHSRQAGAMYGWKPTEFTDDGSPKLDEEILKTSSTRGPHLAEYFLISSGSGSCRGQESWINNLGADGRIHGSVNTIGAVTRRMTHSHPNMAQVPRVGTSYGSDCRGLFTTPAGKLLVGADASGLELRCLAHYMAAYDQGSYVSELLKGDIHTTNQKAAGLPDRNSAKTFIYAFLYGAGDFKIEPSLERELRRAKRLRTGSLKAFLHWLHLRTWLKQWRRIRELYDL